MLVDYLDHYFVFNKSFKIKLNSAMTSFCPLLFLAIFSTAWALEQRAVYYWFYFVILFEHPGTESVNNVFLLYPNYVVFLFFFKYHQIESRADLFVDGIDADLFFFWCYAKFVRKCFYQFNTLKFCAPFSCSKLIQ